MTQNRNNEKLLQDLVAKLELPQSAYDKSVKRYEDLGSWLGRDESSCAENDPHVFPQGSFRLGTAIRPLHENEEYDLDLACCLREGVTNQSHSQKELKHLIGYELALYRKARGIRKELDEKHRCWRLEYQDDISFHMDIVPCIPKNDAEKQSLSERLESYGRLNEGLRQDVSSLAVGITDDTMRFYEFKPSTWMISNPEGYARWFDSRKKYTPEERLILEKAQVDQVPENGDKTPLQQVIQILKRHRDSMFEHDSECKPISVIITTLVADGYDGSRTIVDTLKKALNTLSRFSQLGSGVVPNPVNPEENFADKWDKDEYQHLQLQRNFDNWVERVNSDFSFYFNSESAEAIADSISEAFKLDFSEDRVIKALGLSNHQVGAPSIITSAETKPWCKRES